MSGLIIRPAKAIDMGYFRPAAGLLMGSFFVKDVDASVCSPTASGFPPNP
jgi:hypothetical protein